MAFLFYKLWLPLQSPARSDVPAMVRRRKAPNCPRALVSCRSHCPSKPVGGHLRRLGERPPSSPDVGLAAPHRPWPGDRRGSRRAALSPSLHPRLLLSWARLTPAQPALLPPPRGTWVRTARTAVTGGASSLLPSHAVPSTSGCVPMPPSRPPIIRC